MAGNHGTEAFRKLKPVCSPLSQTILRHRSGDGKDSDLVNGLANLKDVVTTIDAFDSKLAEYVFFPLSYVFGQASKLPRKAIELSLQCLQGIIVRGWGVRMDEDLCKQLLKLLGTLLGRESEEQADQDTLCAILHCLGGLFQSIKELTLISDGNRDELVPILGQVLLTTLTILVESPIVRTQIAASDVVAAMMAYIKDKDTLQRFLPGVVSQLTKVLQPRTHIRRPYKVLVNCLSAMSSILQKALGDERGTDVVPHTISSSQKSSYRWENATSAQVKLALANVVKVRGHERSEVLDALLSLCIDVIKDCSTLLKDSVEMMLETMMFLFSKTESRENQMQMSVLLEHLSINKALADHLAGLVHRWLISLPTAMLSCNTEEQRQLSCQISKAYLFLTESGSDTSSLDTALMTSVFESVSSLIRRPRSGLAKIEPVVGEGAQAIPAMVRFEAGGEFKPLVPLDSSNGASLHFLQRMMESIVRGTLFRRLSQPLAEDLISATGNRLTVMLWFSSRMLEAHLAETSGMREYMNLPEEDISELLDLAFSYAVRTLSVEPANRDTAWEQEAIALEVVALQARYLGRDFRPELVDVLFPIVERIGSRSPELSEHAMVCLNIVSNVSGYSDPGAMIVQNVDYLVNAVALKLNTFTISPQTSQILVMMLHLSGPSLIPYLDDLVDSIFAALASFHGYPLLVESLFHVLRSIIDQGRSGSSGLVEDAPSRNLKRREQSMRILEVKSILKETRSLSPCLSDAKDDHKDVGGIIHQIEDVSQTQQKDQKTTDTESANVPSKSYQMIQSIVRLGQYYLTHESPFIRQQLLQIVSTGCVSLSGNEDQFLPLVNDVWPVVVRRIYDNEPNVVLTAMNALSVIFQHAGDFVSTRVESEWPDIRSLYQRTTVAMESENKWKGGRSDLTPAHKRWSGLVTMLVDLMSFVRITAVMEDDLVDMLGPFATSRHDVREALDGVNADAVWLYLKAREGWSQSPPRLDGFTFKPVSL